MTVRDIKPVNVNFNLRDPSVKNRETAVHCIIRYNNQRLVISSVEIIKPKFWNPEDQKAKASIKFKEYPEFNQRLEDMESSVKTVYRKFIIENKRYPSVPELRDLVKFELSDKTIAERVPIITLQAFIQHLIDDTKDGKRINPKTKQRFAPDTHKAYQNTLRALEKFEKHKGGKVDFDTIGLEFYNDFKEFMFAVEKVSNNYFGLHIKNIKLFMNEGLERGLHTSQKHNHRQFIKMQNETDNIYLTKEQLEILYNLDLSDKPKLDRVRDLFLVGCWTGLRFSDFNHLAPKNVKGNMIEIETQKTGERVMIPIHPVIKSIMKKYERLTENSFPPTISNVKMNEYLKELGEDAKFEELHQIRTFKAGNKTIKNRPAYELITTHTARRSFATNMHLMGVPSITIMAITGHRTEKAFLKYIKITQNEHALKLRELFEKPNMKVVI